MDLILVTVVCVLAMALCCTAAVGAGADAASLIRDMRASEAWVDQVRSLELEVESVWSRPEEAIARRKAELVAKFPEAEITPETFPELRRSATDRLHMAFDAKRAYVREDDLMGPGTFDLRIWDGERATNHAKYSPRQEYYSLDSNPGQFFRYYLDHLPWLRAAPHPLWFIGEKYRTPEKLLGRPEEYELAGRELYRGIDCYVLRQAKLGHHWYVGVQDHRPYGYRMYAATRASELNAVREMARKDGQTALDEKSLQEWMKSLPEERRLRLEREHSAVMVHAKMPRIEQWCLDYREVAPGRFAPMTMGYSMLDAKAGELDFTREMKVVSFAVDQPLDASLFTMVFKDGIEVNDWGHQPPLFYKYKKDRKPEEWQAILDEADKRQAQNDAARNSRDQLLGQSAPEFPQTQWLGSRPLSLADLKGKVVLIDFFSESCGPCRNDFPMLVKLHKDRESSGLIVLGIHLPGSEMSAIEKLIKDYGIEYPVCIDTQMADQWGTLFAGYRVERMPYCVVLDREGRIAGHGSLGEMLGKTQEILGAPTIQR